MSEELKKLIKQDRRDLFRLENHRFFDHSIFSNRCCIRESHKKIIEILTNQLLTESAKSLEYLIETVPSVYFDTKKKTFIFQDLEKESCKEFLEHVDKSPHISLAFETKEDFRTYFDFLFFSSDGHVSLLEHALYNLQDKNMLKKQGGNDLHNQLNIRGFAFTVMDVMIKERFEEEAEIFRFQPSFEKMAEETPLDKNFTKDDIKYLARKSIFKFNPYDIDSYLFSECYYSGESYFQIESAYIWKNKSDTILIRLNFAGYSGSMYRSENFCLVPLPLKMDEEGMEKATINEEIIQHTIEELTTDMMKGYSVEKLKEMIVKCLRKILNIMIYMGADNYYAEQVDFKQKLIEDSENLSRKKARVFRKAKHGDRDYIIIGRPRPKTPIDTNKESYYSVAPHYRKAHWRRQRYGPGRELIKNVFIEGVYIHQDKTDVPIKKKTYIVKGSKEEYDGVKRARERGEI